MKTDLYTKTVLTVIAVCLTVNLLKEFEVIPAAKANTTTTTQTPQPIVTQAAPVDVNISHIGGVPLTNRSYYQGLKIEEINIYEGLPVYINNK